MKTEGADSSTHLKRSPPDVMKLIELTTLNFSLIGIKDTRTEYVGIKTFRHIQQLSETTYYLNILRHL